MINFKQPEHDKIGAEINADVSDCMYPYILSEINEKMVFLSKFIFMKKRIIVELVID